MWHASTLGVQINSQCLHIYKNINVVTTSPTLILEHKAHTPFFYGNFKNERSKRILNISGNLNFSSVTSSSGDRDTVHRSYWMRHGDMVGGEDIVMTSLGLLNTIGHSFVLSMQFRYCETTAWCEDLSQMSKKMYYSRKILFYPPHNVLVAGVLSLENDIVNFASCWIWHRFADDENKPGGQGGGTDVQLQVGSVDERNICKTYIRNIGWCT